MSKSWYASKTIQGIVIMIVCAALDWAGVQVGEGEVSDIVLQIVELVAAVYAVVGRVTATKRIGKPI